MQIQDRNLNCIACLQDQDSSEQNKTNLYLFQHITKWPHTVSPGRLECHWGGSWGRGWRRRWGWWWRAGRWWRWWTHCGHRITGCVCNNDVFSTVRTQITHTEKWHPPHPTQPQHTNNHQKWYKIPKPNVQVQTHEFWLSTLKPNCHTIINFHSSLPPSGLPHPFLFIWDTCQNNAWSCNSGFSTARTDNT